MPQLINLGNELLRINTAKNTIEYSQTGGRSWVTRCCGTSYGTFIDLLQVGHEILACTSKGLYASQNTKPISTAEMTDDEQSYAEEIKFCLEDGTIGDKERRFLERMRTKLGISPERAAEIEEFLQKPQLTEEEQEYLDAVYDEIVNGAIPESARRLLDRLRRSMDISEERAKEIELLAIK